MTNENIYTPQESPVIKPYKMRRLSRGFWTLYNEPQKADRSRTAIVYSLITSMVMQRFTDKDIKFLVYSWHKRHDVHISPQQLAAIIKQVRDYTLEERRRLKREEMQRYRARKTAQIAWIDEMRADMGQEVAAHV